MGDRLCDEVVRWKFYFTPEEEKANEATRTEPKADEVDAAIAELKAENERLKKQSSCTFSDDSLRVRQLKRKIADNSEKILELQKALDVALSEVYSLLDKIESPKASHYAEMVDAGMENRKLKRALWLTRALRARDIQRWWISATCAPITERACNVWKNVERKCRAKAEEYK